MRPAPGTWGSLPPLLVPLAFIGAGWIPTDGSAWSAPVWWSYHALLALIFVIFCGACIVQGDRAEVCFFKKDPSQVVADETAGQCLSLMFLPAAAFQSLHVALFTIFFAFICFRLLDIVKPWPANSLQRVPGGWGILIDDLFAGAYAAIIVQVLTRVLL